MPLGSRFAATSTGVAYPCGVGVMQGWALQLFASFHCESLSSATCSRLPFAAPNRRAGGADVALRSLGAACLCLSSVAGFDLPLYPRVSAIHSFISTYSLLLTNVQICSRVARVISKKS